jgi:hypothetical protein
MEDSRPAPATSRAGSRYSTGTGPDPHGFYTFVILCTLVYSVSILSLAPCSLPRDARCMTVALPLHGWGLAGDRYTCRRQ